MVASALWLSAIQTLVLAVAATPIGDENWFYLDGNVSPIVEFASYAVGSE